MRKISLLILGLCAFLNAENLNYANSNATKPSIVVVKEQNSTNLAIKGPKTGAQSPNAKKQAVMRPETSKSPTAAIQKSAAEANSSIKASAAKKAVSAQLSQTEKKASVPKAGIGAPSQVIKTELNSSAQPSVVMLPPPDELPIVPEVSEPNPPPPTRATSVRRDNETIAVYRWAMSRELDTPDAPLLYIV